MTHHTEHDDDDDAEVVRDLPPIAGQTAEAIEQRVARLANDADDRVVGMIRALNQAKTDT